MFFHEYLGIYLIFNTHKRKFLLLLLTQEAKSRLAIFLNYIHQNPRVAPHLNIGFGQHCLHSAHSLFSLAYLSVWAARFNSPFPAHSPGGMSVHLTFCVCGKYFNTSQLNNQLTGLTGLTEWTDWQLQFQERWGWGYVLEAFCGRFGPATWNAFRPFISISTGFWFPFPFPVALAQRARTSLDRSIECLKDGN